jgi:hypothetical protein
MSSPRIRIQIAVLVFILLPAATGVLAVHASATCERFVRTYVTKPVRNRLSKQTADAWAAWRVAHPNWKPNPKNRRPKYVMTREEAVHKVDFACAVATTPSNLTLLFTPADFDLPPAAISLPPMTTEIRFPAVTPPEVAELASPLPLFPIVPLATPAAPGPVPEPGSWLLVISGIASLGLLLRENALRAQV